MEIKSGQILEGQITRVVQEAAFVDIGLEQEAVIPRKDIDRLDQSHLADIREGELVKVYVYHLPPEGANPLVSVTKAIDTEDDQTSPGQYEDHWDTFEESYNVGDLVEGVVKSIKKYGAFVELPVGVDGLIHVSEMSTGYTKSPWDVVNPGEHVTVQIISIEPERKRIGLRLMGISEDLYK